MGFLFNFLFKDQINDRRVDDEKLKAHYNQINGLYRCKDGSEPSLEDFLSKGFSEDEFFLAVHGKTQADLQQKMMQKYAEKRQEKLKTINNRLIQNSKRDMQEKPIKKKKAVSKELNSIAMFAPFGLYEMAINQGGFKSIIEDSLTITGTPLGLLDLFNGENPHGGGASISPMADLMSEFDNTLQNEEFFAIESDFGYGNDLNNPF